MFKLNYFTIDEFKCPCCGKADMNKVFLKHLDIARGVAETPFFITSGYRCKKHNEEIGGSPNSSHMKGLAADIKATTSTERYKIIKALLNTGFTRIGVGKDFIHVDMDKDKVQEVIWTYYKHK